MKKLLVFLIICGLPSLAFGYVDNEEAYLSLDKPFYVQGETAWFSIFSFDGPSKKLNKGTKFMELSLVNGQGTVRAQYRVKMVNGRGSGQIQLAQDIAVGNYLLVLGYPSEPVENYVYRRLFKIYSANVEDYVTSAADVEKPSNGISSSSERATLANKNISISSNGSSFQNRSKVILNLEASSSLSGSDLSLVVRKRGFSSLSKDNLLNDPVRSQGGNIEENTQWANDRSNRPITFRNPDKHRSLIYELDKVEGPDETSVNAGFSVSEKQEVSIFKNSEGRFELDASNLQPGVKTFYFNHFYFLPYSDNRYRYVRKRWMNGGELKLDWSPERRDFGKVLPEGMNNPLEVNQMVRNYVLRKDLRDKIIKAYGGLVQAEDQLVEDDYRPRNWYNVEDYSVMGSLPEFLREIVSGLKYTNKDGIKDFRFSYPGDKYRGMPLIIVDGVPTVDANKALSIPIADIEGVGVLKDLTTDTGLARQNRKDLERFGYFGKNGILFIDLKNNISNPFLAEYNSMPSKELIMDPRPYLIPEYSESKSSGRPDFRPVLYWNPQLKLDENGKATVEFYTSDDIGEYEIVVEGMSSGGDVLSDYKVISIIGSDEN